MLPIKKEYFKDSEFACKCGCGLNNMDPSFLVRLKYARQLADIPFKINSGCRCEKHNHAVKGVSESSHLASEKLFCYAVDIRVVDSVARFKIIKALFDAGFTRVGIGLTLIHVDSDSSKIQNDTWVYQGK